jgi:hypothetical protein
VHAEGSRAAAPSAVATRANRLRASLIDLTFLIWSVALCFALSHRILNTDGDLPRHIVMGRHILSDGVRLTDVFSHTRAGAPFLAYEWASQVVLALVHAAGGLAGVLVFAALLIAGVYALVVRFMLRRGVDPLLAYVAGVAAALLGSAHWSARPHLFTLAASVALLALVAPVNGTATGSAARRVRTAAGAAVLFAVWANVHPGFVLGLALLGAASAGAFAESLVVRGTPEDWRLARQRRDVWRGRAVTLALACAASAAATLANPQGVGLHTHILEHLNNRYLMSMTDEFKPLNFISVYGAVFVLVLAAVVWGFARGRRRPSMDRVAVIALLLVGALVARRNIPLFGLIALPLLVLELDGVWRALRSDRLASVREVFRAGESEARPGRYVPWVAGVFLLLGLVRGDVAGLQMLRDSFDPGTFPVAAVDQARAAGLEGRIFNEFTWGGYLLYAWPEQRIYIDGMTDFFGEELTRDYVRVIAMESGWRDVLERRDISIVIVPTAAPVGHALYEQGWRAWYHDETAVVLLRSGM